MLSIFTLALFQYSSAVGKQARASTWIRFDIEKGTYFSLQHKNQVHHLLLHLLELAGGLHPHHLHLAWVDLLPLLHLLAKEPAAHLHRHLLQEWEDHLPHHPQEEDRHHRLQWEALDLLVLLVLHLPRRVLWMSWPSWG